MDTGASFIYTHLTCTGSGYKIDIRKDVSKCSCTCARQLMESSKPGAIKLRPANLGINYTDVPGPALLRDHLHSGCAYLLTLAVSYLRFPGETYVRTLNKFSFGLFGFKFAENTANVCTGRT